MGKMSGKVFEARAIADSENNLHIGERLGQIRRSIGITQVELAARLNIGQTALSRLEKRHDIHVSTLRNYIEALGAKLRVDARFEEALALINHIDESNLEFRHTDEDQLVFPILGDELFPIRRDVVFSIKPEYSEKIISGEKTVELRRRFPQDVPAGTLALIYSTTPTRALTGVAEIGEVLKKSPSKIWDTFSSEACIRRNDFDTYFNGVENGFVIKLRNARPLRRAIDLAELRQRFNFEPPQSYLYATPQLREALRYECSELSN